MRGLMALTALAVAFGGAASAAPSVEIKDAVARVVVIPEDRADVRVEFLTTNRALPLTVSKVGGRTVIDGNLRYSKIRNCSTQGGRTSVYVAGVGKVDWANMPQVVIHTPRAVNVAAGGAVFGSVGRSESLSFANAGCGDWTVGNVKGALTARQAGSGDLRTGSAGSADVRIAGSGDVNLTAIDGPLTVDVAGSGDVHASSIDGNLKTNVAGSGDVTVDSGRARDMKVSVAGSGDVNFGGVADSLEARIMGSGDVSAAKVTGSFRKSVMGSGTVRIGR
ncbi:MAG: GIN domain-containing protein [Parcubacteria group bacterium]